MKRTAEICFGTDYVLKFRLQKISEESNLRVALITDSHLEKIYRSQIEHLHLDLFSFPAGEKSKTRKTKEKLENQLLARKFGRDTLLIALGGGVVGDITGFLASTYCRGVPYIQIPTSLLAMVDSSIGGKTGVNTAHGKNTIGSFYPAKEVWIDGSFLKTLPKRQWRNGLVEMIKAGLIGSPSLFVSLRDHADKIEESDYILDAIYESVLIKKWIITQDPKEESGLRKVLNLGHTFGHALEWMEDYELEHGRAVAIGILGSAFASHELGYLDQKSLKDIEKTFKQYDLELFYNRKHTLDDWMAALAKDKKAVQGKPRFVLLEKIGSILPFGGNYCNPLEFSLLEKTLNWIHEHFYSPTQTSKRDLASSSSPLKIS